MNINQKKNIIFDFNKDIIKRGKGIDKCTYDKKNKRIDGGKKEYSDGYSPYRYSLISDMISKKNKSYLKSLYSTKLINTFFLNLIELINLLCQIPITTNIS